MKYRQIIFDVDGTLVDNERAILLSLQETLLRRTGKEYAQEELTFCLGIPGEETLRRLAIENIPEVMELWIDLLSRYSDTVSFHEGIPELIRELSQRGFGLGVVSSRTRDLFEQDTKLEEIRKYFDTVICADDTQDHKPTAGPLLKYLEVSGADRSQAFYIGDSVHDSQCAENAGVDFGLACWGSRGEGIRADYYLKRPKDLLLLLEK